MLPGPAHPRRHSLLDGIDLARDIGLEVGPLGSPAIPRAGTRVLYADHTDAASLRAKYAGHPGFDTARIVDVDVIWADAALADCLPPGLVLDYVFAAHVIEHVADPIGWLGEIAAVLRPGGRVCLAIPDKRFTFDYLRQTTRLGDWVAAHLRGDRRPAAAAIFDHHINAVMVDEVAAWAGPLDPATLPHFATTEHALASCRAAMAGDYIDVHCSVVTPRALLELLAGVARAGLLAFRCAAFHETVPCAVEMLLVLERLPDGADPALAEAGFLAELARLEASETPADPRLAALEQELRALRASTSWRITAPLRRLAAGVFAPRPGKKIGTTVA